MKSFARYAWGLLAYNVLVVLWGAFVRATQSGAGCGNHWPLCNGVVIPQSPAVATIIEFAHRLSSGLSLVLVAILLIWAFRAYPSKHRVRRAAAVTMFFIITEALVGASLVLFQWVAHDESLGRVFAIPTHLVNTFLLLASITITAWYASGFESIRLKGRGILLWGLGLALLGVIFIGASGALTALGDTLYPSQSFSEGFQQDFSGVAPLLIRLRVIHPVIAIVVAFYTLFLAGLLGSLYTDRWIRRFAIAIGILFVAQLLAGLVNIMLLAPVWMQIIHLLLADLVWISLVLLSAASLRGIPILSPETEENRVASQAPIGIRQARKL